MDDPKVIEAKIADALSDYYTKVRAVTEEHEAKIKSILKQIDARKVEEIRRSLNK